MVETKTYKIKSMKKETADTISFVLAGEPMQFSCGQFIMIHYPCELAGKVGADGTVMVDGKPVKRAYSIASSSIRGLSGEIEVCVKAMPDGWISKLLQEVRLGQELEVSGPFGRFVFDPNKDKDIVMLAAGSGIAPFHGFIEEIVLGAHKDVNARLIFSNKTELDIIYRKVFDKFALDNLNIKVDYTLTREDSESSWEGFRGRVCKDVLKDLCGDGGVELCDLSSKIFFICGPLVFVKSMRECLGALGVSKERVRFESYG
jgi:glycine betaine catabolism B